MTELIAGPLNRRYQIPSEKDEPAEFRPRSAHGTPLHGANARLVLLRTAVLGGVESGADALDDEPVRRWATATSLGQHRPGEGRAAGDRSRPHRLLEAVQLRRRAAVAALAAAAEGAVRIMRLEAQGAVVTGTGDAGVRNVGITLHGTYGWPMIPGTALKGVAHAFARDVAGTAEDEIVRLFGAPRPGSRGDAVQGAVTILDALPGPGGVTVTEHVLTPHARTYRAPGGNAPAPPAEYLNPIPIPFLAVEDGAFVTHLIGPEPDVDRMTELLGAAVDEIGVGAKTASGYGYLTAGTDAP
ncbi:CRISPR-associated protein Cmr6 [Actinomadura pelletieri DSM 43383]|uniref:CRISPR-associated protein Cmr6 n=1 Tax=Actinomadura pelletieri DSM 43383 TaxID=1120940 RepID=A0A495Q9S5_9ACTN|nr:type III-B CRISPR module RAMP protein Cmr6 [Actinomadura pelletieri]RKS68250.1 CRISPR-associated protein Cmr6 [Actinomadura pelletieri DSM 43383]